MGIVIQCPVCLTFVEKHTGSVNRARRKGAPIYCSKKCSGVGRRKGKTKEQLAAEKREYDKEYRRKNAALLKHKKAAYHQRTYDPAKAAVARKKRSKAHAEYCRRPEYRAWKREYDKRRRAERDYGEFGDAFLVLRDLESEILSRMSRYEIGVTNQTINKTQKRRREYEKLVRC